MNCSNRSGFSVYPKNTHWEDFKIIVYGFQFGCVVIELGLGYFFKHEHGHFLVSLFFGEVANVDHLDVEDSFDISLDFLQIYDVS